ncbi:phosphocholine cytidylyltransferase family protein [Clostridiaceae bacterium]|nr:phosphocholine cytidylyltransferase family protein [Clostridiaceae bacterium]
MKALILNSGMGTRMGKLTEQSPKCTVKLTSNLTILDLQLQNLSSCGIEDVVITTGPFADIIKHHLESHYPHINFTFVHNPNYQTTNYIYSIALASDFLQNSDLLLVHGDLVFEKELLEMMLKQKYSCVAIDTQAPLPQKDFKAVIENNKIQKIGIEFFENAVMAQPLYSIQQKNWLYWLNQIQQFCKQNNRNVYAENALNEVSDKVELHPFDIHKWVCMEIDNLDDLKNVQTLIKREILKL